MDPLMFREVERQARRMREMIERLDVDTLKLVCLRRGDAYVDARTACFDCRSVAKCLRWLEAAPADTAQPAFCPNLPLFETCRRRPVPAQARSVVNPFD